MFDPTGHALLSEEAAALAAPSLQARARLAEDQLDLPAATYDLLDETLRRVWAEAVVLQINYGLDWREMVQHESMADRQVTYRREAETASPAARALVERCLAGVLDIPSAIHFDGLYDREES